MDYKIDRVKKYTHAYTHPLNCKAEDCPLFSVCPQFKTYGDYLHAKNKIDLLLVFDNLSQVDVEYSIPQVDEAGLMFRKEWLEPFFGAVAMKSYLISHLVRAPLTRNPTTAEMAYCWDHFYAELMTHKPATIIGFGSNIFPQLYMKAKNKEKLPDPNTSVSRLRQTPMDIQFSSDYTAKVFIGYSPNYVGKAPHARKDFHADRDRVIGYLCPSKKIVDDKPYINTENVRLIKTVDEALEVINHLTYGLPKDRFFDLAFDTETENLNRAFNNKFLSWQFTWEENEAVFIPIDHPEMPLFAKIEDKVKLINAFQNLLNRSSEESRISWIVAHNAKFDFSLLYGLYRILPRGTIPIWDTLLGMHWINENRKSNSASYEGKPYSLKTLSTELLGFSYKSEQLAARADGDLVSLPFSELVNYGGTDTILTWHLKQKQMRMANQQPDNALPKLERFMWHYYSPASRAIAFMECNGLYVSNEQLQYLQGEESPIWNRIARIENVELQESPEVRAFRESKKSEANAEYEDDLWGDTVDNTELEPFNPNKKDQETAFYLDFLGLEPLAMSKKTQKPTLNKAFLNHYAAPEVYLALDSIKPYLTYYKTPCGQDEEGDSIFPKNPLQLILEYRELTKLGNTYLESISEMIQDKNGDCIDNRVRASYWLAGTDTGRLSSSNPNLQNLPAGRSKMAKEIKNLFQAEPPTKRFKQGTALIQLDYKTAEVRWAAIFANDKNLIRLFNEAHDSLVRACSPDVVMTNEEFEDTQLASDIHRRTASLMYGIEPAKVSKAQRQASKAITFGLLFGMGVQTLAANNGWSESEAKEKVNMFFAAFPDLKRWLDDIPDITAKKGYVETKMGRRRRLEDLFQNSDFKNRAKAKRLSMNAPIQGQSSDGGTIGLCTFLQHLLDNNLERRWIVQNVVHDSCLVQVPIEDIDKALIVMQHYFVQGMADYITEHFKFTLPLPIECEIEVGLKYGDLTKWDGRPSTLPTLIEKIKADAQKLWYTKKEKDGKPPENFDLVKWKGK
jgi:DNA polymerase I-like protein with 3'-5' exonuclease and polymerase domains